jgi:hypothetical protein
MSTSINCPSCGSLLPIPQNGNDLICPYCGMSITVPNEISSITPEGARIPTETVEEIIQLIKSRQKGLAVKKLTAAAGLRTEDAVDVVESVERSYTTGGGIPGEAEALLHQVAIIAPLTPTFTKAARMSDQDNGENYDRLKITAIASILIILALLVLYIVLR